jgi:TPR repeat protein
MSPSRSTGVERRCVSRFSGLALAVAALVALPAAAGERAPGAVESPFSVLVAQAIALEHGEGVPKDLARAASLYCAAARNDDAEGMFGLGWMYANGRGVVRDDGVAAALFAKAAGQGHVHAKRLLLLFGEPSSLPSCLTDPLPIAAIDPLATTPEPSGAGWVAEPVQPDPFAGLPPHKAKFAEMVKKVAPRFAVEPALALAVIATESNFEPQARSPKDARGLMQLIPETAARFNVRNAYDPADNVRGGLSYLRWLLAYYQGHVALVAAAYNAGEGAVDRHGGVPPYAETRDYVQKVMQLFRRAWHPYDPAVAAPSRYVQMPPGTSVDGGVRAPGRVKGALPARARVAETSGSSLLR